MAIIFSGALGDRISFCYNTPVIASAFFMLVSATHYRPNYLKIVWYVFFMLGMTISGSEGVRDIL